MSSRTLPASVALAGWLLVAPAARGQVFQKDRAVSLTAENDALGGSSDSAYTNGIRVRWTFMHWNDRLQKVADVLSGRILLKRVAAEASRSRECALVGARAGRPCGFVSFGISQTMYTPSTILDTMPRPDERPYAGMLFATLGLHQPGQRVHSTTELVLGVIGPWSGSESTQSLAHWTWATTSEKPRGWRNQLRNQPQVSLNNFVALRPPWFSEFCLKGCDGDYKEGRILDVTGTGELVLGTHMRRASAGYIARLGIGFPDVVTLDRISTTGVSMARVGRTLWEWVERYQPWFFVFYAQDGRQVWYNAFLEGSSADQGGGGWRDISVITLRRAIGETTRGVSVGVGALTITYQKVQRTTEYDSDGGRHTYGSLTLGLSTAARPGGS